MRPGTKSRIANAYITCSLFSRVSPRLDWPGRGMSGLVPSPDRLLRAGRVDRLRQMRGPVPTGSGSARWQIEEAAGDNDNRAKNNPSLA